jgi:predicted RNase H-like nuclease (RuvC/YqgF family)
MDKDKVITIQNQLIIQQEALITNLQNQLSLQKELQTCRKPDAIDSFMEASYKNRAYAAEADLVKAKATISHLETSLKEARTSPRSNLDTTYYRSRIQFLESELRKDNETILQLRRTLNDHR